MSKFLCVCFLMAMLLPAAARGEQHGEVVVISLKGEVNQTQFYCVRRALKSAEEEGASAVIVDLDTFGGENTSAIEIMNALMKSRVPTYAFVNDKAISAGAMISVATGKIYMSPTGVIGAAAPVRSDFTDMESTMKAKELSVISAKYRDAAQKYGYREDLLQSFSNSDVEVKIGAVVINAKGSLTSLNATEAVKLYGDKPLLATGIVSSISELMAKEKLTGQVRTVTPSGFEVLALWLTNYSFVLLLGGVLGAYLEAKFHGTMISGLVSLACFILFFTGQYFAGLAGWEIFIVFFIGVLLLASEIFVHPGTIFPGIAGVILIIGSLLWAMIDRYPGQPLIPTTQMLGGPVLMLLGVMLASLVLIYVLGKYLPKTHFMNRLALATANPQGPSLSATSPDSPLLVKVGETGVAKSNLRPSGKAEFGTTMFDVVTQGEFVAPYSRVRIVAIEGPRIVVESC